MLFGLNKMNYMLLDEHNSNNKKYACRNARVQCSGSKSHGIRPKPNGAFVKAEQKALRVCGFSYT